MTDGPTGIQVAPIASEEDMSKLASMFQRAANAVVAASEFPAQLSILSKQVEDYKHQIDGMTSANEAMTNTINELRAARDDAQAETKGYKHDFGIAQAQIEGLTSARTSAESTIAQLNDELDRSRKDSDEHLRAYLDTSDELTRVKAKLAKLTDLLRDEGESSGIVVSNNVPSETPLVAPSVTIPIIDHGEGNPPPAAQGEQAPHPLQTNDPALPSMPDTLNEWQPGYGWDSERQLYVRS